MIGAHVVIVDEVVPKIHSLVNCLYDRKSTVDSG